MLPLFSPLKPSVPVAETMYLQQQGVYGLSGHINPLRGQGLLLVVRWRRDWRKFSVQEENNPVAPCLPRNYHGVVAAWESFTYQMWDLSSHTIKTFPPRFFSRPLVSSRWFSGGLVSISSAALPHPPLLRLMNISSSRSDSPPPAPRSYSQTRSELSVPITFRWWPCRCASVVVGEHIAVGGSVVCFHASYTLYHSLLEFKEDQASTQDVAVME